MKTSKTSRSVISYNVTFLHVLPYVIVPLTLYLFVLFVPLLNAFRYSFYSMYSYILTWRGLGNFVALSKDGVFWWSLKNNLIVMFVSVVFQAGVAFVLAALMTTKLVHWKSFVQSVFFFPCIISPLVTAYIWKALYSEQYGVLNKLLGAVGLDFLQRNWLSDPRVIMTSICIPLAWQYIGFYLVIFLAGLTGIEREILEVAEIDGANFVQRMFYIVLPLMKGTIKVALLICVSGSIKIFDQIYAMSMGGPGNASMVVSLYAYDIAFKGQDFGYASAISVAAMIISLSLVIAVTRMLREGE
jgi:raffinose/stachyose/melibiose transport system permease protein